MYLVLFQYGVQAVKRDCLVVLQVQPVDTKGKNQLTKMCSN